MDKSYDQSVAERLATQRGISAKPSDSIRDVPVDYEAYVTYVRKVYAYVRDTYEDEVRVSETISEEEFLAVNMAALASRVRWTRSRAYGFNEGPRVASVGKTLPIAVPIFGLLYSFGHVKSSALGLTFVPGRDGLEAFANVPEVAFRRYMTLVGRLKHYFPFSEGMPSQSEGTWAYLLYAQETPVGVAVQGPTNEATKADAMIASFTRTAKVMAGMLYGFDYALVSDPDMALYQFLSAHGKGIGAS